MSPGCVASRKDKSIAWNGREGAFMDLDVQNQQWMLALHGGPKITVRMLCTVFIYSRIRCRIRTAIDYVIVTY